MTSAKQQEALNLLAKTQYTAQDLKMIDHYISLYEKSGVAELRAEIRSREGKSVYDTWSPTDYNYVEAQQVKHREFGTVHQYKELLVRKQILNRQIELKQKYPKLKLTGRADQLPPDVYLKKIASFSGKVEQQADNLKVTLVKNVTLPDAPYLLQVEIDNKVVGYKTLDPKLNVNQAKTYIQKFSKDLFEVKQQLEENKKLILEADGLGDTTVELDGKPWEKLLGRGIFEFTDYDAELLKMLDNKPSGHENRCNAFVNARMKFDDA
jgi:hypothetical protein